MAQGGCASGISCTHLLDWGAGVEHLLRIDRGPCGVVYAQDLQPNQSLSSSSYCCTMLGTLVIPPNFMASRGPRHDNMLKHSEVQQCACW